jgi:transposase
MDKFKKYYGIDISKDVFDVVDQDGKHSQYENNRKGYKSFVSSIGEKPCVVMEATGVYHVQFADYLYENSIFVSVVNPLVIKRFIQMNLRRIKTDKADAQMICKYAISQELRAYKPCPEFIKESRILVENIDLLIKSRTMLKNRVHALKHKSSKNRTVIIKPILDSIKALNKQIEKLEIELENLVKVNFSELYSLLRSIPGIGKSTALFFIVLTEGFEKFESAKQFTSYVGLSPSEKSSGTSVRGSSSISKQGNPKIRNLLFMCSFNACKANKACRDLFARIVAKGKSKKLALIAVANKLIKQAFAIAKSKIPYDPNFRSVKPSII